MHAERKAPRSSLTGPIHASSSATVFREKHSDGDVIERHAHAYAQLVAVTQGLLRVSTPAQILAVPPMHAVWLPAGLEHEIMVSGRVDLLAACFIHTPQPVKQHLSVVPLTPLLSELLRAAAGFSSDYPLHGPEGRLINVILDQLAALETQSGMRDLPLPASRPLQIIAAKLMHEPGLRRTLEEWGDAVGASPRTLERRFQEETGLSFSMWRKHLRMNEAYARLLSGEAVTSVALAVGYGHPSAFIKAFRAIHHVSPMQLMSNRQQVAPE